MRPTGLRSTIPSSPLASGWGERLCISTRITGSGFMPATCCRLLPVAITVFARSNYAVVGTINVYPPNFNDTNSWNAYTTNGFQVTTNAYGLTTTLSGSPSLTWGAASFGAYVLTHGASAQATNYYYLVASRRVSSRGEQSMAITSGGGIAPSLLYTLEFEQRPAWRSVFIDQPHFDGSPLPPFYAGKTLAELLTNTPPVTNAVASGALGLHQSGRQSRTAAASACWTSSWPTCATTPLRWPTMC